MGVLKFLLKEGRKEDLKKKYSDKFDEDVIDWILNISDLVDFNHKYTDFVFRVLENENMDIEWWVETIIEELKLFDKYQNQLEKKDINQYKTFDELQKAVTKIRQKEKEKELESQVDKIYEDDTILVVAPKTEQASCKYGSNTKWCTAAKNDNRFATYTQGSQKLYYIINKKKSSGSNYSKIAIHFNNSGRKTYWDSTDFNMNGREIEVLNYAFPEMMEAIDKDHSTYVSKFNRESILRDAFDTNKKTISSLPNYLESGKDIFIVVDGFDSIPDMKGHYEGTVQIDWSDGYDNFLVDKYNLLITVQYKPIDGDIYRAVVEFTGVDFDPLPEYFRDLGLETEQIKDIYQIKEDASETHSVFARSIANKIRTLVGKNPVLQKLVVGDQKLWMPNRFNYGYTFKRADKGYIKKLTDWLDAGKVGTKLDFLTDVGKLDKKVENGKTYYSFKGKNSFLPSVNWRGEFSSFFASARLAGILGYKKEGNKFLLVKGPNFDAFKEGNLKAL
jgi:D-Tyr-tRNAtyr deacylase